MKEGEVKQYRLVGCDEFDPAKNWISIDSPVARALIGKGVDDEIHVETTLGQSGALCEQNLVWKNSESEVVKTKERSKLTALFYSINRINYALSTN
mgnify:CR=1 FL=1